MTGVNFDAGNDIEVGGSIAGRDIIHGSKTRPSAWRDEVMAEINQSSLGAVDRVAAKDLVDELQDEVRGDPVDVSKIERIFNAIAEVGPDLLDIVIAGARGPLAVVGVTVEKINEKAVAIRDQTKPVS